MNRRLSKIIAAFGAVAAITGLTGCNSFLNNRDRDRNPTPDPAPLPTSHTYYFSDTRTDLCFSATFTDASRGYTEGFSRVDCTDVVKKQIAADAPRVAEKMDTRDIGYNRDPSTDTCLAGNSQTYTPVPCTDKVMALVPAENTGASIGGPATTPQMEGQNTRDQDDLDLTIPGTGIILGGDGVHGYPQLRIPGVYDGDNPLAVPRGTRPLPTGTATGPHGEQYAFYAVVPYFLPDGRFNDIIFTAPDTVVVDLAHPERPLFLLKGISQASGAYDAQTGRMVIMGNTQDGHRALWQSAPLGENWAWGNTLQPLGTFSGAMDANRESQIIALPSKNGRSGGFLAVGAGSHPYFHYTLPVEAVTAATPQGLLTAKATELIYPQTLPQVYGPTITDIQEVNGKTLVTMRVSTFGNGRYDPHTYKSTFTLKP